MPSTEPDWTRRSLIFFAKDGWRLERFGVGFAGRLPPGVLITYGFVGGLVTGGGGKLKPGRVLGVGGISGKYRWRVGFTHHPIDKPKYVRVARVILPW